MSRDDALTAPADCLTLVMPLQALRGMTIAGSIIESLQSRSR
jgi:hypothetical protein